MVQDVISAFATHFTYHRVRLSHPSLLRFILSGCVGREVTEKLFHHLSQALRDVDIRRDQASVKSALLRVPGLSDQARETLMEWMLRLCSPRTWTASREEVEEALAQFSHWPRYDEAKAAMEMLTVIYTTLLAHRLRVGGVSNLEVEREFIL